MDMIGRVGVVSGFVRARILPIAKTKITADEQDNGRDEDPLDRFPSHFLKHSHDYRTTPDLSSL